MTVPVVIVFSKARERIPRDNRAVTFNFVDVFGKGARGRIQQGTAANRTSGIYMIFTHLQGAKPICFLRNGSSVPIVALCVCQSIREQRCNRLTAQHDNGHVTPPSCSL
ncbi:hypothetical protein ABH999_003908 [Bradyrhizobium yuanmingense]|uniref:hypothetical protein n=1 Tax=Bradyrhizobium yuanmingense TaxID=108015 RepID=UPI0012FD895B|nr:hypothetical protein [Bradyrhizobium yuanmingense]